MATRHIMEVKIMKNPRIKTTIWVDEGVHHRAQFFGINISSICRDAELKAVMTAERNRIRLENLKSENTHINRLCVK